MSDVNLTVQEGSDVYLSLTETPAVVSVTNPLVAAASFSVTVGTSVTVSNFPATQGISGTVAITEIGNININDGADNLAIGVQSFRGQDPAEWLKASGGNVPISGSVTVRGNLIGSGLEETGSLLLAIDDLGFQNPVLANGNGHLLVSVQSGTVTASLSSANLNSVTVGVRGSVTIANFPATQVVSVSNFPSSSSVTIGGFSTSSLPPSTVTVANTVTINGTVTANVPIDSFVGGNGFASDYNGVVPAFGVQLGFANPDGDFLTASQSNPFPISGTVTVGNFPDITDGINGSNLGYAARQYGDPQPVAAIQIGTGEDPFNPVGINNPFYVSGTVTVGNSVTIGSLPAISGTVTVSNVAGFNIPTHDFKSFAYTSGNLTQIAYKTGGASGTTVGILTLAYDGSGNLTSMTKT